MEEEDQDRTPFWLQGSQSNSRWPVHRSSSIFFSSGFLIILLLVTAFALIFFIVPSFLSFTSQVFRPHLVKKSWDSLNLVLVLFAIICGFLSRNTVSSQSENHSSYEDYKFASSSQDGRKSNPATPRQWHGYSDRTGYSTLTRLRSSSSHPDLRQEASWVTSDDRWRFYDDTHLYSYRFSSSDQLYHRSRPRQELVEEERGAYGDSKDIVVDDTSVTQSKKRVLYAPSIPSPPPSSTTPSSTAPPEIQSPPRPSTPPQITSPPPLSTPTLISSPPPSPPQQPASPPPPLPPKVVKRKTKRTYQDLAPKAGSSEEADLGLKVPQQQSLQPPPPPPPPPPPMVVYAKSKNNEKKRGGVTKEFLISLRRKKKKQRQKSVENLESIFHSQPSLLPPPTPPPLPPPPFFHNLFSSKKGKSKKPHSIPPSPPPLPPPPPSASLESRASRIRSQQAPITSQKAALPAKVSTFTNVGQNLATGSQSPLIPIPPPPPPPPFKMSPWKFVVQGDYVRLASMSSRSRSASPDPDGLDETGSPDDAAAQIDSGGSSTPLFCPSPDVDTKADNFIARFRAGLKLEKMNSVKEKQGRTKSNLGPDRSPCPVPDTVEAEDTA